MEYPCDVEMIPDNPLLSRKENDWNRMLTSKKIQARIRNRQYSYLNINHREEHRYMVNDQTRTYFDATLGRFTIIFNPHVDTDLSSEDVANIFYDRLQQGEDVTFDWIGVDTNYGENDNLHTLYYIIESKC